jgi:hypothetical protein
MKGLLISLFCLLFPVLHGQEKVFPNIKSESTTAMGFVPKGWMISDSAKGDLNKDQMDDLVLLLKKRDSVMVTDENGNDWKVLPRMLMIAFQGKNGRYALAETNGKIVMDYNFPATYSFPFNSLKIQNNVLEIAYSFDYVNGNFQFYTYKFRFQKGQFVLIGSESEEIVRRNFHFEKVSYNFLTMKWSLTVGDHADPPQLETKTEWFKLNLPELKTFKSMRWPGSWELVKGRFL